MTTGSVAVAVDNMYFFAPLELTKMSTVKITKELINQAFQDIGLVNVRINSIDLESEQCLTPEIVYEFHCHVENQHEAITKLARKHYPNMPSMYNNVALVKLLDADGGIQACVRCIRFSN